MEEHVVRFEQIEVDRRMVDFCVGLDTEFSEVVEGSHLYFPKTKLEQVRLFILFDTCEYQQCCFMIGDSSKGAERSHTEHHQQF